MARYDRELRGPLMGPGGEVWRRGGPTRRRGWREWEDELDRRLAAMPPPRRSPRHETVREIHSYSLDYGSRTGGPAEYSGRAGYAEPYPEPRAPQHSGYAYGLPPEEWWPRGVRTERIYERDYRHRPSRYEEWHWSAAEPSGRGGRRPGGPRRRRLP